MDQLMDFWAYSLALLTPWVLSHRIEQTPFWDNTMGGGWTNERWPMEFNSIAEAGQQLEIEGEEVVEDEEVLQQG